MTFLCSNYNCNANCYTKLVYKSVQHFLVLIFVNCNLIDKGVQGAEPCNLRSKMYSRVSEGR